MTNKEFDEICEILSNLQNEFIDEEERLIQLSRDHAYQISDLENQIITCKNNEDIDFRVFSPRNISIDNSEKVQTLEKEKASLERDKEDADRQIGYYSSKSEKIGKVLFILKKNFEMKDEFTAELNDKNKEFNPFAFIDEDNNSSESITSCDDVDSEFFFDEDVNDTDDIGEEKDIFEELIKEKKSSNNDEKQVIENTSHNEVNDLFNEIDKEKSGVPVDDVKRVCHKVEFTEKIINNDRVRAKLELKEVINDLSELIKVYDK